MPTVIAELRDVLAPGPLPSQRLTWRALVFALLDLVVFVWSAAVMSNTVAEAHDFTAWHGLGTIVLSALVPVIVAIAALLAAM